MIWRVVMDGLATLTEIRQNWSYLDLIHANIALDARVEAEHLESQAIERESKRK